MSRILVVDDEPHIRRLITFSLQKAGHEVFEAGDGVLAQDLAAEHQPDLILMDVMMPIMTGYEAIEKLKANDATRGIPVAMLSAKSQKNEVAAGIECGATRYICKPFTPKELVEQVAEMLSEG